MLSDRQQHILQLLIEEYVGSAEPVSSELLKKKRRLDISPATIRNEFQELAEKGFIAQPHTSAGRVPTQKAYRFFVAQLFDDCHAEHQVPEFIFREIERVKEALDREVRALEQLADSLRQVSMIFSYQRLEEDNMLQILEILGPSKTASQRNMSVINQLIRELQNF